MTTGKSDIKKYNLALPQELFDKLQEAADRQNTTVVELLRRFVKMGLILTELEAQSDTEFIIRTGNKEQKIIFL